MLLPLACSLLWVPSFTPLDSDPDYHLLQSLRWWVCLVSCIVRMACFRSNVETTLVNETVAATRTQGPVVDHSTASSIVTRMRVLKRSVCLLGIESLAPLLMSLLLVLTHKSALNLNLGMCETLSGGPSTIEAYQEPPFNVMRNNFHGKVLGFLIW
eukprot:CAMPEP_0167810224 /NCGR_PEP_ID=MMETSP0111_2-20121227/24250_1 /TAXON_ID=91324 /ORGANISM="Lotharella globosa, Strain CCCM811" /LENGTH=155 /DNA_ID=CAMNT_0007708735 /DNA_START=154 /DNA_END=618 /DNA_ORIENTATION=-